MEKENFIVGDSLRQVLLGKLLTVLSLVASDVGRGLALTPLMWLGTLVGVVGIVMVLLGLTGAVSARVTYRKALVLTALELVANVVMVFLPDMGKGIVTVVSTLLACGGVWAVCTATGGLLEEEGEPYTERVGLVWKLYAAVSLPVALAYAVFLYAYPIPAARLPVILIAPILQLAALFVYLRFLDRSRHLLREK